MGRYAVMGALALVLVGGFLFFLHQGDARAPTPQEISVPLPDAFKE